MLAAAALRGPSSWGVRARLGLITTCAPTPWRVARRGPPRRGRAPGSPLARTRVSPRAPPTYKAKRSAQEAHEAIDRSAVEREPKAAGALSLKDQLRALPA